MGSLSQLSGWPQIRDCIRTLKAKGRTAQEIAVQLNREGRTSSHSKPFTASTVRAAMSRCGLTDVRRGAGDDRLALSTDEWFVPELAQELGVRPQVIYVWIRQKRLVARQVDGPQGRWVVHADAALVERLKTTCMQPSE